MIGYDSICCFRSRDDSVVKRVCWEITTDCNLKCPFCHRYNYSAQYYDVTRLPSTVEVLKSQNINEIIISGGEPLLHPNFFELLDYLLDAGFTLDVCTNGTLLDCNTASRLKERLCEISISIDGYEKKHHEEMRQIPGCFEKTMEGVRNLINIGMEVHATTVIDSRFVGHIVPMTNFLYENGIRSVAYIGLIPLDTGVNNLFSSEIQALLEKQIQYVRSKYKNMEINTKQLLLNHNDCSCGAGNVIFGLGVDGLEICSCLLKRERVGKRPDASTQGLCPGSRYLTQPME